LIRLTRLVEDLHQLSLAEAKRLTLERRPTDMHALLERIVDHLTPDAEAKGIALSLERLTEETVVSIDPHRMTQVFLNLFVNAVRHTPDGGNIKATVMAVAASGVADGAGNGPASGGR